MVFAFLIGASFPKRYYQSKFGVLPIAVFIVAALLTVPHIVYEVKVGTNDALQSMLLRVFDIVLLSSLTMLALYFRRKPDR